MGMVEPLGPDSLREPHARHLDGKRRERRAKAAEGIARGLCVTTTGRRVVVLHAVERKSDRTPPRALSLARERMRQVLT